MSNDLDHVQLHAAHLRAGDDVVGVAVGDDEEARDRAADALRIAGAAFINYYGDNYIQSYEADLSAQPETRDGG